MTLEEQTIIFSQDLHKMTTRYANEFNLTYEAMIGALEMHKLWLIHDFYTQADLDAEDEEGMTYEIWNDRVLDVRFVEINHPKIVALEILDMQKEIDKLRYIIKCLENKINENAKG